MKNCKRLTGLALGLAFVIAAVPALAAPMEATISLGRDPEPPMCVANPGGTITITWDIEYITTPNYVWFQLEDPTRTIIYDSQNYPDATGVNAVRNWTVPGGAPDGKYWIRVEYWSFEASNEANAEVTFYVCTGTGEICAKKLEDTSGDGACDEVNDTPGEGWWIGLVTPYGDTYYKSTGVDGIVCWDGLMIGDYTLIENMKPGWQAIGPDTFPVTLTGGTEWVTFCNEEIPVQSEETSWGKVKTLFR